MHTSVPGGHDECFVSLQDVVTGSNRTSTEGSRIGLQSRSWFILRVVTSLLHNRGVEILQTAQEELYNGGSACIHSEGYGSRSVCLSACLCVCLSPLILTLQAPNQLMSDTNGSNATGTRKLMWRFR